MNYRLLISFFILLVSALPCNAWFNRGLDDTVQQMQRLFEQRQLVQLYNTYVHEDIKRDVNRLISTMKAEKIDHAKIATRLGYKDINAFCNASNEDILIHFFDLMKNSRYKVPSKIKNSAYLRLALSLSLLFAFLDNGMKLVDKDVGFTCAILTYKGNSFIMKVYFYYQNKKWFLTDGRHC